MTEAELVAEEEKIPALAVRALAEADRAALASGLPVVQIENGRLVRIAGKERLDLGPVAPDYRVSVRKFRSKL